MSIIKRGAMALAVMMLIVATVPTIVGSGNPESEKSSNVVEGPPQSESPRVALAASPLPTVAAEQISVMFQHVGANPSLHADGSHEGPQKRLERIAQEINSGLRSEAEVRQTIAVLARQQQVATLQGNAELADKVRRFFLSAGVSIPTSIETEEARLGRIVSQVASGERTLAEVERTIQAIAAGLVGFNPDVSARFGGRKHRSYLVQH